MLDKTSMASRRLPLHSTVRAVCPHCLRVELFFSIGLQHGLIGTRATNRLDMQYYWYTPFAQVFASRDRLHQDLSPYLLESDQTFADGDELVAELRALAERRSATKLQSAEDTSTDRPPIEPEAGSLIHRLWVEPGYHFQ